MFISPLLRALSLILFMIFAGGCSLEASIGSTVEMIDEILAKVAGKEIVSASAQQVVTENGYVVQSSVSYHSGGANTVQTEDKYLVETGTQSILFKRE